MAKHLDLGYDRTYTVFSRAYWREALKPLHNGPEEIYLALRNSDGITRAEFSIRWVPLGNGEVAPKLNIFDEYWWVFVEAPDLFFYLSKISEKGFLPLDESRSRVIEVLERAGFRDVTPTEVPE